MGPFTAPRRLYTTTEGNPFELARRLRSELSSGALPIEGADSVSSTTARESQHVALRLDMLRVVPRLGLCRSNVDEIPAPESFVLSDSRSTRILVVANDLDLADSFVEFLEGLGHDVRAALSGAVALDALRAEGFDVAIIDIGLPTMDGYEVAKRVRTELHLERMVLIAVTGYDRAQDRDRATSAGFDFYMTKPVDVELLQRILASRSAHGHES